MDMWGIHDNIGKYNPCGLWGIEASVVILDHLESLSADRLRDILRLK